jgi:hypothetical protein
MGAIKIWSTTTFFESAVKLVALSLRERRGNLNSRYLFQRPMTGPNAKPVTVPVFHQKVRGNSLMPAPKEKNRSVRGMS